MKKADKDLFERSWMRAWKGLEASPPEGLLDQLIKSYSESQRKYHTLQHLAECLDLFETGPANAVRSGEVEIALWFHDAIYDVHKHDNEQQSAEWARRELANAGVLKVSIDRVVNLVLVTHHDAAPTRSDECLLCDIDLCILASNRDRFAEYERQIREEYSWVPEESFQQKRKEILWRFLDRPFIFSTPEYRQKYEAAARQNLQSLLIRES